MHLKSNKPKQCDGQLLRAVAVGRQTDGKAQWAGRRKGGEGAIGVLESAAQVEIGIEEQAWTPCHHRGWPAIVPY
eukprot:scaffold255606_cov28-Tisochrysis_lutea.AAC.1